MNRNTSLPSGNCRGCCQGSLSGRTSSSSTQSAQRSWWTARWNSGQKRIMNFFILLHNLFPFFSLKCGRVENKTAEAACQNIIYSIKHVHYLSPKSQSWSQNMMKICKACNKPFSHLISQFHTWEKMVETLLHSYHKYKYL